ncbi:hypothetical protein [Ornithinimicrobium panacihumi]|uniref:hypothetical protein n=1 Tax=Ornithinimicrobium panacihumi TaxID=2008449 RepID=UPI003F8C3282
MRRTGLMVTTALLAIATLGGCADTESVDPGTATITAAAVTSMPTEESAATSSPPRPADAVAVTTEALEDDLAIQKTVEGYFEALDEAYSGADVEIIYPWSRDVAREKWVTQLISYREQELTFGGTRAVEMISPPAIEGDGADVRACLDYSQATVTNAAGEDVTPERTSNRLVHSVVLEREEETEYGWIVVDDVSKSEPCPD